MPVTFSGETVTLNLGYVFHLPISPVICRLLILLHRLGYAPNPPDLLATKASSAWLVRYHNSFLAPKVPIPVVVNQAHATKSITA